PQLLEILARRANWAQFVPQPGWSDLLAMFPAAPWALGIPLLTWCLAHAVRVVSRGRWMVGSPWFDFSERPPLLLACCWYLGPLAAAALLTYTEVARICYPRYLIASSVALPVAAGWLVAVTCRRHVALGLLSEVLTVMVVTTCLWG